jgi:bifunctional non-homologous end joining protein LigD
VGQVGSGITAQLERELRTVAQRFPAPGSPFFNEPRLRGLHHLMPLLVVEVAFSELTHLGTLRHPSLKGLRADKEAGEVVWDDELSQRALGSRGAVP